MTSSSRKKPPITALNRCLAALILIPLGLAAAAVPPGGPIFRGNCAFCHALNGKGGRGPSLVSSRVAQTSDEALRQIVRNGIPGTGMPAFELEKEEVTGVIAYIRGLGASGISKVPPVGDARHGKLLYASAGCSNCHRIGFTGSIYGPELTRIGLARSVEYLRESILNPSADIPAEYAGVSVVTKTGKHVSGVRINEDTFSVQLRLPDQEFALFQKDEVNSVQNLATSLMPPYSQLPRGDVDDLVAFLTTLQGGSSGSDVSTVKGIR